MGSEKKNEVKTEKIKLISKEKIVSVMETKGNVKITVSKELSKLMGLAGKQPLVESVVELEDGNKAILVRRIKQL